MTREEAEKIVAMEHSLPIKYIGEWQSVHVFKLAVNGLEAVGSGLTVVFADGRVGCANPAFNMDHIGDGFTDWYLSQWSYEADLD